MLTRLGYALYLLYMAVLCHLCTISNVPPLPSFLRSGSNASDNNECMQRAGASEQWEEINRETHQQLTRQDVHTTTKRILCVSAGCQTCQNHFDFTQDIIHESNVCTLH